MKDSKEDDQWDKLYELNTDGYQIQTINRINKRGGGVVLITKEEAKITPTDTNNYTSFEHKTWNIQFRSKPTYTVTGIYHLPSNCQTNNNNSTFLDQFHQPSNTTVLKIKELNHTWRYKHAYRQHRLPRNINITRLTCSLQSNSTCKDSNTQQGSYPGCYN